MPVLRPSLPARTILRSSRGGAVLGIVGLVVQGVHDGQAYVQADQIAQGQGPMGWLAPSFMAVSTPSTLATPV